VRDDATGDDITKGGATKEGTMKGKTLKPRTVKTGFKVLRASILKARAMKYRTLHCRVLKYRRLEDVPLNPEVIKDKFYTHDAYGYPLDDETRDRRLQYHARWESMSNDDYLTYNIHRGYLNPDGSIPERYLQPSIYLPELPDD
jgi:hypothetical protein